MRLSRTMHRAAGRRGTAFRVAAVALGAMLAFALGEATLRIWDPFGFRNAGGEIYLPRLTTRVMTNDEIPSLDRRIVHTRNELGFRGESYPKRPEERWKILAVGGSTTECYLLSDGKDWPALVAARLAATVPDVWMNNAGLDGHSTRGHLVILEKAVLPLRPQMVIFLTGVNDAAASQLNRYERHHILSDSRWGFSRETARKLVARSRMLSLGQNLVNASRTRRTGITHRALDVRTVPRAAMAEAEREALRAQHRVACREYGTRLRRLVAMCREAGAEPVLLTQPALFGPAADPVTGVDLGTMRAISGLPGDLAWEILELYNEATREVGRAEGALVVDLAREVPHSSACFYDYVHLNNEGAEVVAAIVAEAVGGRIEESRGAP